MLKYLIKMNKIRDFYLKIKTNSLSLYNSFLSKIPFKKFTNFINFMENKATSLISKISVIDKYFNYFFIVFTIILYILFKHYFVYGMGWDDGRFYMFYPAEFYETNKDNYRWDYLEKENYGIHLSNTMFFFGQLEKVGLNYKDFYFLIFFLSYFIFFLCLKEIKKYYKEEGLLDNYFLLILSILYPSNQLIINQVWNNHFLSIYTLVGTPLVFLLFLKLILKKIEHYQIILFNLIFTVFFAYFGNFPIIFVTTVFFGFFSLSYFIFNIKDFKFFISRLIIFIIIFLSCNLYNLYSVFNIYIPNESTKNNYSKSALNHTISGVRAGGQYNNLNFIFLNGTKVISNYNNFFNILQVVTKCLIFSSFLYLSFLFLHSILKEKKIKDFFSSSLLISGLILGYLQTIPLTEIGFNFFIFLSNHIFALNSLRNYINKVAPNYSIIPLVCILIFYFYISKKSNLNKFLIIFFITIYSLISTKNVIDLGNKSIVNEYDWPSKFSSDTYELFSKLKSNPKVQRILSYPLGAFNFSLYKNEKDKELYIGWSALKAFTNIDDINNLYIIQNLDNTFFSQDFESMGAEKIFLTINFLGINRIVINNTIDLNKRTYILFPHYSNYQEIKNYIVNNLKLDFETRNKEFSVYNLDNNKIQFKKYLYQLKEAKDDTFYSLNYKDDVISFDKLPFENFNYIYSINNNSKLNKNRDLNIYNLNGKQIEMNSKEAINTITSTSPLEKIYLLNTENSNLFRIVLNKTNSMRYDLKVGVDSENNPCLRKLFNNAVNCKIFNNLKYETVNDSYVYSLDTKSNYSKYTYVYLKVNTNPNNIVQELNPKFYLANSNSSKYNPFNQVENKNYLDNYFISNPASVIYQTPEIIEYKKPDKNTHHLKIKLQDSSRPFILVLKDYYNPKWLLEAEYIQKQEKFKADYFFNGWVVYPEENKNTLELKIKFTENKYLQIIKKINNISIYILVFYLIIYFLIKLIKNLINKYGKN